MLLKSEQWFCTLPELGWYLMAIPSSSHIEKERKLCTSPTKTSSVNHIRVISYRRAQKSLEALSSSALMRPISPRLGSSIFETCSIFWTWPIYPLAYLNKEQWVLLQVLEERADIEIRKLLGAADDGSKELGKAWETELCWAVLNKNKTYSHTTNFK